MKIYEFMYLNSLENLWFSIRSTVVVMQRSFNPAPLLLWHLQDQWVYHAEKFHSSATTAVTFARPMSLINLDLEANKFKSSADQLWTSTAGNWSLLPDVPCTSCICQSTLLQFHAITLSCFNSPSPSHGLNAQAGLLVVSSP